MKILINEQQLNFLVEQTKTGEKIYTRPGDPYEYKFENGKWFGRKKGSNTQFLDISKYQKSIDILNKEFPQGKTAAQQKTPQQNSGDKTNKNNSGSLLDQSGNELLKNPLFMQKLEEVSKNLGFQKEWLIKLMRKESRLNPHVENTIGCVGLIQFCPDKPGAGFKTIGDKKYNLQNIKKMSGAQQLSLVEEFYKPYVSKIKNYQDLYMFTFYPAAFGKPDNHVIGSEKKDPNYKFIISKQNPAIAKAAGKEPGKDTLTVADFKKYAPV